ncbi:MAG: hypothetical protein IKM03_03820 [Alistipes sp.]|nr:hypothetical protein [Alistipes sp.]
MNIRRLYILFVLAAILSLVGCNSLHDEQMPQTEQMDYIKLHFSPLGKTRGTIEDNEYESYLRHLDIVIYKLDDDGITYSGVYHERVNVSDTPDGVTTLRCTKKDFEEDRDYKVYVIANCELDESIYYKNGDIISHTEFLNLDQTNSNIHLSGIEFGNENFHYPQMFLMDGVAYMGDSEPATQSTVIINKSGSTDDVVLKVTLRRAAAKIVITIKPGDKVTLTPELMAKSQGYLLRNMPIRTTLVEEGEYPLTEGGTRPYWASPTISQTPYFSLLEGEDGNYNLQITAYCYSHYWDSAEAFEKGTSLVVMLPILYKEDADSTPVEYINNYYQISFSKKEGSTGSSYHRIKRNTLYDLRIRLNAPGAEDYSAPEEMEELHYFTTPWQTVDIEVSGENTVKYLKVNKNKLIMYNIAEDLESLYFSSSSPVTVTYVPNSGYYLNKYSERVSLSNAEIQNIYGMVDDNATSGNIGVHSEVPTNNTIRYFQIQVKNQEGLTEIIDVEQYPLIYITNSLPWYSYRDDYFYRTTDGHDFRGNVNQLTASGDNPTTYQYDGDHVVSIYTIDDVDLENKTAKYTYTSASPTNGYGWTASKVRGNKSNNSNLYAINYYAFTYSRTGGWWGSGGSYSWKKSTPNCETHNVRNYKVRVMATSHDYTLARPNIDEYGFTAGDDNNAKLVSPSFVIASRLGAVLSTYSNLDDMSAKEKLVVFADHCKNYVEVDDVNDDGQEPVIIYDNWRLPTEAELRIIMDLQGGDGVDAPAIDFLLNGGYYMSASGPVFNPKNTSNVTEAADKWSVTDVAIRCVRDAY